MKYGTSKAPIVSMCTWPYLQTLVYGGKYGTYWVHDNVSIYLHTALLAPRLLLLGYMVMCQLTCTQAYLHTTVYGGHIGPFVRVHGNVSVYLHKSIPALTCVSLYGASN